MKSREIPPALGIPYSPIILIGMILMGWGISIKEEWYSPYLLALGSSLLGSSVTALITSFRQRTFYQKLHDLVADSTAPSLNSLEDKILPYRKILFRYSVTQVGKEWVWRCTVLDFSKVIAPGRLAATVDIPSPNDGGVHAYAVEGALRNDRLILVSTSAKGNEQPTVQIFPNFGRAYHGVHSGVQIIETWTGVQAIAPCLISDTAIAGCVPGTIEAQAARQLDQRWSDHIASGFTLLPRIDLALHGDRPRRRIATTLARGDTQMIDRLADGALATSEKRHEYRQELIRRLINGEIAPTKYLYATDQGSNLWLRICQRPSYAFFHESLRLLQQRSDAVAEAIVQRCGTAAIDLVSLGSGNGEKDNLLIRTISNRLADGESLYYYPVDVSETLLTEAVRTSLSRGVDRTRIRVKAIVADFLQLRELQAVFEDRPANNLFSVLGNTVGNADESALLSAIANTMLLGDLLLIEVNISKPEKSLSLQADSESMRHDFTPLESLGIEFDPTFMEYSIEDSISAVPDTKTLVARYKRAKVGNRDLERIGLSAIHHYNLDAFRGHLQAKVNVEEITFWSSDRVGLILVRRN